MSQIKISVPNDDHVALRTMAKALEEIAVARGAPAQGKHIGELNYKITVDTTEASAALEELVKQSPGVDTTAQELESLSHGVAQREVHFDKPAPEVSDATTDSTGTPWDDRIHSASKALNGDGTWRVRRKPADMESDEWSLYVAYVQNELQNGNNEPSVTPQGDDFHVDAGEVSEQEVASIPAPPPPPVVPQLGGSSQSTPYKLVGAGDDLLSGAGVTPQTAGITATSGHAGPVSYTFPQVMQFLTERHGCITSPQVDQIIADMGLNSIMDIRDNTEHAGPFIARVKALLGE